MGKTTLILKLEEHFRAHGLKTAGMVTQEVRSRGQRVGFMLRDLASSDEGWLAKTEAGGGPKVGKYTVVTADLENVGVRALTKSIREDADVVLVDEIGPMEMTSRSFRKAVADLLNSDKTLVATVKYGSRYEEVETALKGHEVVMVELTRANRETSLSEIVSIAERRPTKP